MSIGFFSIENVRFGEIIESDFVPPWWARNCHVQTIFPRFFQKRRKLAYRQQKLTLPDDDFVNLIWAGEVEKARGLIVLFHGLEGSIRSHYTNDMMANLVEQGYAVVLMHFRGCGAEANLTARAYHSGETEDAWFLLNWLDEQYPQVPKAAMGFSLGANMLLKLLSEKPQQRIIQSAMAISVPFQLAQCSDAINQGFSRVYQSYLLKSMVKNLQQKMQTIDYSSYLKVDKVDIGQFKSFRDFDQHVTAPLHGFKNADDYYQQSSSVNFLQGINTPTLVLHAIDDPFMLPSIVPKADELSPHVAIELSKKGGHVGFMQGSPWRPKIWMQHRANQFFAGYFDQKSIHKGTT